MRATMFRVSRRRAFWLFKPARGRDGLTIPASAYRKPEPLGRSAGSGGPSSTSIFEAALPRPILSAIHPGAHLPKPPKGRTIVIWAGKGAAQMAAAFEKVWEGPLEANVTPLRLQRASTQRASR